MSPPCPHCGEGGAYAYASRAIFKCCSCGRQFSAISGSALKGSKLPADKVAALRAAFLDGQTPAQIARSVGVQYRTAHYAVRRLRAEMTDV